MKKEHYETDTDTDSDQKDTVIRLTTRKNFKDKMTHIIIYKYFYILEHLDTLESRVYRNEI